MPDINGIPYVESTDLVSGWPTVSQSVAQEVSDQLASKLPYSFGTATPSTTDSGFLWYDSNSTPAAPKFWDGAAFQSLSSGKILQIVRATDTTERSTTSATFVDVTGVSVTITPKKSDSAIIVIVHGYWQTLRTTSSQEADARIVDGSNNPISGAESTQFGISFNLSVALISAQIPATLIGYATPATTSATTYKLQHRQARTDVTSKWRNDVTTCSIYAIEVAA